MRILILVLSLSILNPELRNRGLELVQIQHTYYLKKQNRYYYVAFRSQELAKLVKRSLEKERLVNFPKESVLRIQDVIIISQDHLP